jgi:hypothetical protein
MSHMFTVKEDRENLKQNKSSSLARCRSLLHLFYKIFVQACISPCGNALGPLPHKYQGHTHNHHNVCVTLYQVYQTQLLENVL